MKDETAPKADFAANRSATSPRTGEGQPLTDSQVAIAAIAAIAATTTSAGPAIEAELATGRYDLGMSVAPAEFHVPPITPTASAATGTSRRLPSHLVERQRRQRASPHRPGPDQRVTDRF